MRLAVVDASVALSWVFSDEETSPRAIRLLLGFHAGQLRLTVPSLWEYEVTNALKVAVDRGRISEQEGRAAGGLLFDLGLDLCDFASIAEDSWKLALAHHLSIYDAAYLALAKRRGCEFYTADKRLVRAATRTGLPRWIGEFE